MSNDHGPIRVQEGPHYCTLVSIFLERSLVNHLDEAIIGESLVEQVNYSDNETLEEIEAIFENSNTDSSNNKGKELRQFL